MLVLNVKKTRANAYRGLNAGNACYTWDRAATWEGQNKKTQEHVHNKGVIFEKQFQSRQKVQYECSRAVKHLLVSMAPKHKQNNQISLTPCTSNTSPGLNSLPPRQHRQQCKPLDYYHEQRLTWMCTWIVFTAMLYAAMPSCRLWKPVASHGIISNLTHKSWNHYCNLPTNCPSKACSLCCLFRGAAHCQVRILWRFVFPDIFGLTARLSGTHFKQMNYWIAVTVHPVKYWCRKNNWFLTQIRTQVSTQLVSKEVAARSEICHPAGKRRLQTILRIIWAGNIQHFGAQIWCPGVPTPGMHCPLTNSDRMRPVALLI